MYTIKGKKSDGSFIEWSTDDRNLAYDFYDIHFDSFPTLQLIIEV